MQKNHAVRLEKIILFCADVLRLVGFYQKHFDLKVIGSADENWTVMDAGGTSLAFHKMGAEYDTGDSRKEHSNVKIVFELDSDLKIFRENLIKNDVEVGPVKQFSGVSYLICDGCDPEGNVFQVMQNLNEPEN
ncbi:MAG: VOC family protein [Saprospiraceae bacterium]